MYIVYYILLCLYWGTTIAVPTYKVIFKDDDKLLNHAKDWLRKYGYLDASSYSFVSSEDLQEAMLSMKRFHGIPTTGDINQEMIRIMNMPRCGFPDTIQGVIRFHHGDYGRYKRYTLSGAKWSTTKVRTYGFHNFSPDLSLEEQRAVFSRAINEWTAAANIDFKEVPKAAESDIEVLFADGSHLDNQPFDGQGGTLAHAFFPDHSSFGGDLHFDDGETFSTKEKPGAVDFYYVALHELGHSLGIAHSTVPEAIMFPVYRGFDDHMRLAKDDIAAIQRIYGKRNGYQLLPDIEDGQVVTEAGQSACSITYDAILRTNSHIYFFKGDRTWQSDLNFKPANHASLIMSLWQGGPSSVDAAFTKKDNSTVLLSGDSRWEYFPNSFTLKPGFPKINDDIGIPSFIDAAVFIEVFGSILLFKGDSYWTIDRETLSVRASNVNAANFKIPTPINAAFSTEDKVYFLTGDTDFFLYDASPFQPATGYPKDFNEEVAYEICEWCNTIHDAESNEENVGNSNEENVANRSRIYVYLVMFGLCLTMMAS